MKNVKRFFLNALMLTAVSFFMRSVSVAFNIYVSNRVGAEAMGLFALITGVYGFALTLATSGINLAVTRLVSESMSNNNKKAVKAVMTKAFAYCLFFGLAAAVLLWFFSKPIGLYLLEDERTVCSLKIFALSLPFISISSALNGYFTAMRRVYKNAAVSIFEQGCKIYLISFLLNLLLPRGIEYTCVALVLGGTSAEFLSCFCMMVLWLFEKKLHLKQEKLTTADKNNVLKKIMSISLPVAFSAYARSALLTVEHALIPRGLRKNGATHMNSLVAYGSIHSMAFPIILFPSAFISSFSGLLIPELAECREKKNTVQISYIVSRVFQFTLMFSIGVAGVLMCFSHEIGQTVYPDKNISMYIGIFAPLVPIMYLDSTVDAMLKGLGYQVYSMNVNIFDSLLSVIMVWILLPSLGIYGYMITIYVCEILNAALSITKILIDVDIKVKIIRWIFRPIACIVGASCLVKLLFANIPFLHIPVGFTLMFAHLCSTIIFYLLLLCMTSTLTVADLKWILSIFLKKHANKTIHA